MFVTDLSWVRTPGNSSPTTVHVRDGNYNLTAHTLSINSDPLTQEFIHLINDRREFPPCPRLANRQMEQIVRSPGNRPRLHKKYEFLGDLWINQRIAKLILMVFEAGPLREYDGAIFKALMPLHNVLKSNRIFSLFAYKLGLSNALMQKESANVFEAFCYALSVDPNQSQITPWVSDLFTPLIQHAHDKYFRYPTRKVKVEVKVESPSRGPRGLISGPGYHEESPNVIVLDDDDDDEERPQIQKASPAPTDTDEDDMDIDEVEMELIGLKNIYRRATILSANTNTGVVLMKMGEDVIQVQLEHSKESTVESYQPIEYGFQIKWKPYESNENVKKEEDQSEDEDDDFIVEGFSSKLIPHTVVGVLVPYKGDVADKGRHITLAHPFSPAPQVHLED